jgi:hypothetical protein
MTEVDEEFIRARVKYELVLKQAQGNHIGFTTLDFKGVEVTRSAEWMQQIAEALVTNTTCTTLDLSETGLNDTALQQLAATLAVPSRAPKLKKLCLGGNPQLSKVGETIAQGLCKLRAGLELSFGESEDAAATIDGFAHQKQLIPGLSAWWNGDLAVPGQTNAFYCPDEILAAAGRGTGGEKIELQRGFQGPNGVKYKCDLATFELFHSTGNLVLLTLEGDAKQQSDEGVVV